MAFDAHKNFAYSQVATAPSPATSGTSLTVVAGDGAKFPAASFNAIVWPVNSQPTAANAEIVRVTVVATDTFTITRTQESTSARAIVVGDQIAAGITAKSLTDIENLTFNPYKFSVYRNTTLSLTDTAWNLFAADTKLFDTGTNVDVVTNKGRFTAPIAGFYQFNGYVGISNVGDTVLFAVALYKNGVQFITGTQNDVGGTQDTIGSVSSILQLAANDYVELFVYNGGVTKVLKIGAAQQLNGFNGFFVSAT